MRNTVLIIENEPPLRKLFRIALEAADCSTVECDNGKEGMRLAAAISPDLILLDLGLADMDGKDVIAAIRKRSQVPIIVCSIRSDDEEIVNVLELGADDYLIKPVNPMILLAHINAQLRKAINAPAADETIFINGRVRMDTVAHEVFVDDKRVEFTPQEYDLLRYLLQNKGKVLLYNQLLMEVFGESYVHNTQYLRVYIGQLRKKIENNPAKPKYILTQTGIGYRMDNH